MHNTLSIMLPEKYNNCTTEYDIQYEDYISALYYSNYILKKLYRHVIWINGIKYIMPINVYVNNK